MAEPLWRGKTHRPSTIVPDPKNATTSQLGYDLPFPPGTEVVVLRAEDYDALVTPSQAQALVTSVIDKLYASGYVLAKTSTEETAQDWKAQQ